MLIGTVFLQKLVSWLFLQLHTDSPQHTRTDSDVSGILFLGKLRTRLQECGWGFRAHSLLAAPSCGKMARVSSVHCQQASPRHARAGMVSLLSCQPPRVLHITDSRQVFLFLKMLPFPPFLLGPEWLCCRIFSVLSLNRCEWKRQSAIHQHVLICIIRVRYLQKRKILGNGHLLSLHSYVVLQPQDLLFPTVCRD